MKGHHLNKWTPLTADGGVQCLKYSFGPGTANSLAIKLRDGTWLVVSPPSGAPACVYDALDQQGGVSALLAPNAYHNRGQSPWRKRFPGAVSYAPSGAHSRLLNKTAGVEYRPVEELEQKLQPARVLLPDGMKSPDVLMQIPTKEGSVWWMGDQFSNSGATDQIWLLRVVSRLVGGGLGYRCNSKPELVYVRDRAAWLRSIRGALEELPPTVVVPAHGDPVAEDTMQRTRRAIDAVDTTADRSVPHP
jgi:hypothetical protein